MKTKYSNISTSFFCLALFLLCTNITYAALSTTEFTKGGIASKKIERTFLRKIQSKKHNKVKSKRNRNKSVTTYNPLLDLSIDVNDMMVMFENGNKRIFNETADDTINTILMDVGYANADTQYWAIPALDFINTIALESIDSSESPFKAEFPTSNLVFKTTQSNVGDHTYVHYELNQAELFQHGNATENYGNPIVRDWFETEAFLPIEYGWEIEDTITSYWAFDPDIDSLVETKFLTLDATGILTPINEDPVDAVISYLEYTYEVYKNGIVTEEGGYDAFVWFSKEGHWIIGYLAEGSPTEGIAEFTYFTYNKNIIACPSVQDLGIDLVTDTYKAQTQIKSGATLTNGPIEFVAGQEIELKNGFSTSGEFEAIISANPCGIE